MNTSSDRARAVAMLAALNRSTNRIFAGTRVVVAGTGGAAAELLAALRQMGAHARLADGPDEAAEVVVVPEPRSETAARELRERFSSWLAAARGEAGPGEPRPTTASAAGAPRPAEPRPVVVLDEGRALTGVAPLDLEASTPPGVARFASAREEVYLVTDTTADAATGGPEPGDASAAARGAARIAWATRFMPVTRVLAERLARGGELRGVRIAVVLVLEPKTAVLALELTRAGAEVRVFAPAEEVDPETAAALRARGLVVLGGPEATPEQEAEHARDLLRWGPQLIVDDGAHLIRLAHRTPEALAGLRGAAEETTSGVRPLRAMEAAGELAVPVVPVNDAGVKTLFDNRYGTGQTCVFAIADELDRLRAIDVAGGPDRAGEDVPDAAGSTWLVLGYGHVGEGVARHARALGATVVVAELDPVRALAAEVDGFEVSRAGAAAARAEVVVSATGVPRTVDAALAGRLAPGAVIAVAGGVDGEVDLGPARWTDLSAHASRVDLAGGGRVTVLAHGHGVNYTAGGGNPVEIMDLSFAAQLAALQQLIAAGALEGSCDPGLMPLERDREDDIARIALAARGSVVDASTPEQSAETAEWRGDRYAAGPAPTPPVTVYSADLVIPVSAPSIRGGAVAVRGDRIVHVGDRGWVLSALRESGTDHTEEFWPGVIAPGLVNAHTHLQYTGMAEVAERAYEGFDDWAAAFDVVYRREHHDWAAAAARGAALALAAGTTACADVVTDRDAVSALHDAGMHGIAYWEVMGWSNAEWRRTGRDATTAELDDAPATPGVGVSPHAPYSLDVQPLLDVPDIVRGRGMRLHIHLAEAHMERESQAGHEAWPELGADSFRALRSLGVGVSSTQFVDHLGVLGPDCHVAHGVYVTERDRSLLRARGTSVALCPRSNRVIGLDLPPVAAYLREGNAICVGTDSLSSAPSLDPLADVGALYRIAREQGYAEPDLHRRLFGAATLGGAHALGLSAGPQRVGQLAVGALADLAFFDIPVTDPGDALAHLVEHGEGTCRRTIVAGVTRFERGR